MQSKGDGDDYVDNYNKYYFRAARHGLKLNVSKLTGQFCFRAACHGLKLNVSNLTGQFCFRAACHGLKLNLSKLTEQFVLFQSCASWSELEWKVKANRGARKANRDTIKVGTNVIWLGFSGRTIRFNTC